MGDNTVVITVRGGLADVEQKPKGVTVVIRDYDIETVDEDRLTKDPAGEECWEELYDIDLMI